MSLLLLSLLFLLLGMSGSAHIPFNATDKNKDKNKKSYNRPRLLTQPQPFHHHDHDLSKSLTLTSTTNTWTEVSLSASNWNGVAMSETGLYMIAAAYSGGLYYSSNYGQSWLATNSIAANLEITAVSMDSTGTYAVAASCGFGIYYSIYGGSSWSLSSGASTYCWLSISIESSGKFVVAAATGMELYISASYGETWTALPTSPTTTWSSISISGGGTYYVGTATDLGIYISSDLGKAWSLVYESTAVSFSGCSISDTGEYMYVVSKGGYIYFSNTYGSSWSIVSSVPVSNFVAVTCSSSGQFAAAASSSGVIYLTEDYGVTWQLSNAPSGVFYSCIASSSDGMAYYLTGAYPGYMYEGTITYSPTYDPTVAPTAQPTAIPSILPTVQPSTSPTAAPSALPTISPTDVPSALPTISPTDIPSALPTISPTEVPSTSPTVAPSGGPSASPTASPTAIPTIFPTASPTSAPTNVPTLPPTCFPTLVPTIAPTVSPTISPTASPSAMPTPHPTTRYPTFNPSIFSYTAVFTANITIFNMTSTIIDTNTEQTLVFTTAISADVSSDYVSFVDGYYVDGTNTPNSLHMASNGFQVTSYVSMIMTMKFALPFDTGETNAYTEVKNRLSKNVNDGNFTLTLRQMSVIHNSSSTASGNASTVYYSATQYVGSPTYFPSPFPTVAPTKEDIPNTFLEIGTIAPGILIMLTVFFVLNARDSVKAELNELNSAMGEIVDALIKCTLIVLTVNIIINKSGDSNGFSFLLILLSRIIICILWLYFVVRFFNPLILLSAKGDNDNANGEHREISLILLLHKESLKSKFSISVYGVLVTLSIFDVTFLRLLPWIRTDLTHALQGFPNVVVMRICLYGVFLSHLLQSLGLIIEVAEMSTHNDDDATTSAEHKSNVQQRQESYLLLGVTIFNVIRSLVSMFITFQIIQSEESKLVVVREDDVAAIADLMDHVRPSSNSDRGTPSGDSSSLSGKSFKQPKKREVFTPGRVSELLSHRHLFFANRKDNNSKEVTDDAQSTSEVSNHNETRPTDLESAPSMAETMKEVDVEEQSQCAENPLHQQTNENHVIASEENDELSYSRKPSVAQSDVSSITMEERDEYDSRGIRFSTASPYADENLDMLRQQIIKTGKRPVEYMPLESIQAEIAVLFSKANNGVTYDEGRLDYLLACLDLNPQYRKQLEEEKQQWLKAIEPFVCDSLDVMRAYVPPHIFYASLKSLVDDEGMKVGIAKRLMMKKCLWLIRVPTADINRIHIAELNGRFNPEAQGLDIVEVAAIYGCVPEHFTNDPDGKKEKWRQSIEQQLKALFQQKVKGTLPNAKKRNPMYKEQAGLYVDRDSMHEISVVSSEDAFKPRSSFKVLSKASATTSIPENTRQTIVGLPSTRSISRARETSTEIATKRAEKNWFKETLNKTIGRIAAGSSTAKNQDDGDGESYSTENQQL